MRVHISGQAETYEAEAFSECCGESIKDIHRGVQPPCPPLVGSSRPIELLDLLLEHGENGARRVACLELGGEGMCHEIIFGAPLVDFQCIMEHELKVGSGG